MDLNLTMIIIIILFGFIAAFIDSVVGVVVYFYASIISNRSTTICGFRYKINSASSFGSLTSAIKFIRSGKVDLYVAAKLFGFVFWHLHGAYIANDVPSQILKPFNHYCTFVGVYIHIT